MPPDTLDMLISLGGLVLAMVGLPIIYLQLRDLQRSVRGSAHAAIYVQAADFRAHLIQFPHLRPYFFDGVEIDPEHEDYARVLTIAELVLNYLEHITVMGDAFGVANQPALDRFCAEALGRSPILRDHLASMRQSHSDALVSRLDRMVERPQPAGPPALLMAALLAGLAAGPAAAAQAGPAPADSAILVRRVTVIDASGPRPGQDVVVRGGRIESVTPTTEAADFPGRTIDGAGRFLIPGLIDAHVHVGGANRDDTAALLEWAVQGGVTALRDMAGDARSLAGIQQALVSGELTGPALYYVGLMAGPPFMSDPRLQASTQGYGDGEAPYMIPLTAETDLVRAVAMIKGTGATGVKLYAALDAELVEAATREAHAQGLQVWAHSAVFPAKPVELIEAGVDGVSHAPYVIWEAEPPTPDFTLRAQGDFARIPVDGPDMTRVIEAMVRNGTVLDPTLHVFNRIAQADPSDEKAQQRVEWAAAFTRRALDAGVVIAAGTDNIGRPLAGALPNVHEEIALLVELAGFTPLQALEAATRGGAYAIGVEDETGMIEPGRLADLVLLDADPTVSIENTRRIAHVIRGGRVVR